MTTATRFLIQQATQNIDHMNNQQKTLLWQGLADVLPEKTEVGQLARHNLVAIQAADAAQASFFEKLNQRSA